MAPFANSSTRRFDLVHDDSNRLIAAPYYLRLFQPDCHVALQMFSNATTVHVLRRPVISRSSLLVARSADRDSSLADPCALLFSCSFSFSFFLSRSVDRFHRTFSSRSIAAIG